MLDPYDRELLLDALRPPEGCQLDLAVGTTYSLDLMALLSAPLAFSVFAGADASARDPLVLLEAVRANAARITLFCDAGHVYVPPADRFLFAYLEDSVVECVAPLGGSFHPKVWVLRYREEDGTAAYRFLCLSRNLTFDRSWDSALVLDGGPTKRVKSLNDPLRDFVNALLEHAVRPLSSDRHDAITKLATELRSVQWDLPRPFKALDFVPLGHGSKPSPWPFDEERIDRLLVMTPFTSTAMIRRLGAKGTSNVLVSRPDQLDQCDAAVIDTFAERFVLDEASSGDSDTADQTTLRGLHAKLYVADAGWDATVWTGSANATASAFERNVEFLVALDGKKSEVGIDRFLTDPDQGVSLRTLLRPYVRTEEPDPDAAARRALERDADQLRRLMALALLELHVERTATEDELYDCRLIAGATFTAPPSLESLEVWPITRRQAAAAERIATSAAAADELTVFVAMTLERLTPFLAVRAHLRSGEQLIDDEFVLSVPLVNPPYGREARLLSVMLTNRGDVLRYLMYLLSGDEREAVQALGGYEEGTPPGADDAARAGAISVPLLEVLLRALDREPEKLEAIRRVVDDLRSAENDHLLPQDWDAAWAPILAAIKATA